MAKFYEEPEFGFCSLFIIFSFLRCVLQSAADRHSFKAEKRKREKEVEGEKKKTKKSKGEEVSWFVFVVWLIK